MFVVSIFSDKAKGCRKGCIAAGMFMGEPLDTILSYQKSAKFSARRRPKADKDREQRSKTNYINYMKGIYGGNMPVVKVKQHIYVRMDLDNSKPGDVKVSMDSYIIKAIEEFTEEIIEK